MKVNKLMEFCTTDRQREILAAYVEFDGSSVKAGKKLGIGERAIQKAIKRIRENAVSCGYDPKRGRDYDFATSGQPVSGYSTLVRLPEGDPSGRVLEWVKTKKSDAEVAKAMEEYVSAIAEGLPSIEPIESPEVDAPNLLNQYTLTDYHLGMMAWHEETGADWDMKIAESLLIKWFQSAVKMAPDANTAILANIGDFLHWDGMEAVTPAHRHILDADTRFSKLSRIASRCIVQVVRILLAKHNHVHIIMCDANHDPASQAWFRAWLPIVFENEPRVTVDESPSTYNAYQFGKVGLFYHHGHKRKVKAIDSVFARQFREIFGSTQHCYAHMGHLHNDNVVESNLMVIEQHRTLSSPDAYAANGGWLSGRSAKVITYHNEYGEVARNTITPQMLGF